MSLARSRAVLELGKRLVAQLDASDDFLASWMAHHLAERIRAAENASGEDKIAAEDACATAVLDLWRHQNSLPDHLRPLGELEPVQRALASLDVDETDYRYHRETLRKAATADADEDTKEWLDLAFGIDYTARFLIGFVLRSAAQRAASKAEPWVKLAAEVGADGGREGILVRFVRGVDEDGGTDEDEQAAALLNKLSRLESFAAAASSLAKDLRATLECGDEEQNLDALGNEEVPAQ